MAGGPRTRDFDLVVLGATGFTGRRVLEYLLNLKEAKYLRIAAAGRNVDRIWQAVAQEDAADNIEVFPADVAKPDQLAAVARATHILLNCIGPYRHTGETVVAACVSAGTDYLDVSGEPEFMERAELRFSDDARSSRCFVVSACGFDSIPADIGTLLVQQTLPVPSSVEAFHSFHTTAKAFRINYATWESAVRGFGSAKTLRELRRQRLSSSKFLANPKPAGPKPQTLQGGAFDSRAKAYVVPFPGSDAAVVRRTQRVIGGLGEDTVHFRISIAVKSQWNLLLLAVFNFVFSTLALWQVGRFFLLRFPEFFSFGVFSKRGPSLEQMQSSSFSTLLIGKGYHSGLDAASGKPPNKESRLEIRGPDPGYIATPIFLVHTAMTLLKERDLIVSRLGQGGVFTPGALLHKTAFPDRIREAGIVIRDVTGNVHT